MRLGGRVKWCSEQNNVLVSVWHVWYFFQLRQKFQVCGEKGISFVQQFH